MTKRNKYIYWVATLWLALGMVSTAVVQLLHMKEEVEKTSLNLGYPLYMLTILGVWKLMGVLAVLLPKLALLKEWAYAGFFFIMTGAIISHLAVGEGAREIFGPALLLILTVVSWNFRPADRKLIFSTSK
jgi:hypothetical protein